jgi:hypothetical protein
VRFCCGLLLTAAFAIFYPGSDRSSAFATTIIPVTTNADNGDGSLRQAIIDGNTSAPPVTIGFAIPPFSTVVIITPQSPLPTITNSLSINGFTQLGSSPGTNLIALDGSAVSAVQTSTGLTFAVSGSVEGLIIQNFTNGVGVSFAGGAVLTENTFTNNQVGFLSDGNTNSLTGNVLLQNITPIAILGSSNTLTANLIIDNTGDGVDITGTNSSLVRNLISSSGGNGVTIAGDTNSFAGNTISNNASSGVFVTGSFNTVGGTTAATRNVISGNANIGIDIDGNSSVIAGNYIGVDATGTNALGNLGYGIVINGSSNTVGGTSAGSTDIISANAGTGIEIIGDVNVVQGNFIGTDATGTNGLPNLQGGVLVHGSSNTIGGPNPGAGNVISGNTGNGIEIAGSNAPSLFPADANVVQGNFIGTDASGTDNLGNSQSGVLIDGSLAEASTNLIGGESSGEGNIIAFNGSNGVTVVSNAVDNAIFANSIFTNAVLGIDLGANGVTTNHPFGVFPSGPNNFQNFPVLTAVICSNGGVLIHGSITNSVSSSSAHLEFFANAACDPSGFGQGQEFFGSADVTTDLSGGASFALHFSTNLLGEVITATASDSSSNTSEFSECIPVAANQPPTISQCAASITASADTNCEAIVPNFTGAVVASDLCTPTSELTITQTPTNGAIAFLGTNTVTITVTNQVGLSTNCTTSFIVVDNTPPQITCPSDITTNIAPSQTSAVVTFPTPPATNTNHCPVTTTVTCVPASGSIFPVGTTPVVCTALDSAGNTASCTFTVRVTAPVQVVVDIAPGFCPVVLNTNDSGVIPVAIVGTESLDVSTIIPASVTLNGVLANTNSVIEDVAAPFLYTHGCPKKKKDGIPDLVVEFNVDALIASLRPVKNGEVRVLTVNGTFLDGNTFEGQDKIKISTKKCKLPKGLKNPF